MHFWKYCGAGNDFVILENFDGSIAPERYAALAATLCREHFSVGADGLMVLEPPAQGGDCRMRFYNRDGSTAEMCGNGARCICRYGYETGLAGPTQRVETTAGLVIGERISQRAYRVRLNDPTTLSLHEELEAEGAVWPCAYVELGNPGLPHAVVPYPGLAGADPQALFRLGRALRNHPRFPKGANVNFYEVTGPDQVLEKTYERGVEDFTLACGTGTGSVVTVLTLQGKVSGKAVEVQMTGGELIIDAKRRGSRVERLFLTGPTNIVCKGQITDEDLAF